ncbi:MAG: adenylyl-sulfate kinase, partial [Chloroflexi bacterium]|nr:adenylyl-sulfate kinase [Chloroflexota bacterium]
ELVIIDGDAIRQAFGDRLGYREEDRVLQIKRLQRIANMLAEQGLVVLVAALYANPELLAWNRKNLRNYHEVYLEASVETVRRRDPKGLYDGATQHVVGIDIPWHAPVSPDVTINVDDPDRPEALARRVIRSMPRFERMQEAR